MQDKHYQANTLILNTNMQSNIYIGKEATEGLYKGIKKAVDSIRLTYGNMGCNAVIENVNYPYHEVANDAQTIIQAIQVTDPVEKRGLGFLKELMDKANASSGDGRKTTAIIAETIIGMGFDQEKLSGNEIKRELDSLIPVVEGKIDERIKKIIEEEVHKVASIAGESKRIGNLVGDIYKKIGKEGIIHVEGSGTYEDSVKFTEGVRFQDTGFLSPYMVHDEVAVKEGRKETKAVYENPTILVTKQKINHINDINPLLATLQKKGVKTLVIFTDDMDSNVASLLVGLHKSKQMNILIIKASVLWKNYVFEDFAKCVGATIVEDASGVNLKNFQIEHLGICDKIVVDKDETVLVGTADLSNHIAELVAEGSNDSKLRVSWLNNKTAILKLGANSESELSYLRLKTNDAINSSRLALKGGVVEGGGLCLVDIATEMPHTLVGQILATALSEPYEQICRNGGNTETVNNEDVVDSALVIKNAVRNAVSLAGTILTCGVVVTIPEPTEKEIAMMKLTSNRPF